jgi:YbbR domain-containing protein
MMTPEQHTPTVFEKIKNIFLKDGALKLLSVSLAIFLFIIVKNQQVREFTRSARIKIITSETSVLIGPAERSVDVTVRLPENLFSRLPTDEELTGQLDLRKEKPSKLRVRLSRENFPLLDKRFSLVVHDPWLEAELDALVRKKLSVKAVLQGLPAQGLEVDRVLVVPEEVEVAGSRRELQKSEFISTSPLNIDNIDKTYSSIVKLVTEDFSSLRIADEKVNVQVLVSQKKLIKKMGAVPVEFEGIKKVDIRPNFIDVEISGPTEVLQVLKPFDVRAFVDTSSLESGWQERKIKIKLPKLVQVHQLTPETVSVRLLQ